MMTPVFFVLVCLLALSSAVGKDRLERIRRLYEHDGIDTATVHISYPHSTEIKRLTKREAKENLIPQKHDNFTVKVTLKSSGRVLDLQLQRSRLQVEGALVTVMKEGGSEEFHVQDEGCHYQGFFDDNMGMASVHFCDGVLVGGAHNRKVEYNFHSHHHPLPDDDDNDDKNNTSTDSPNHVSGDSDLVEHYHVIVSWKNASVDFPSDDTLQPEEDEEEEEGVEDDDEDEDEEAEEGERKERRKREIDSRFVQDVIDSTGLAKRDGSMTVDPSTFLSPVVEFGVIFDEDFLRDRHYLFPTRRDLIHFLMFKYTGVQALYGDPKVTGFNMTIQVKLIYLWHKNPSWYKGSALNIGQRMGAGANFSKENVLYNSVDVGALYTSQAPGNVEGMAAASGACLLKGKTFASRGYGLNWITECHELGHTLGLAHVSPECHTAQPPNNRGFMTSYVSKFLPCYRPTLDRTLRSKSKNCLFRHDVGSTNIPPFKFQGTFPILAFGRNYHCSAFFKEDAVFVDEDKEPCGSVLCAVMDKSSPNFGMAQVTPGIDGSLIGRSCGPNGRICLNRQCKTPKGNTTVKAVDKVTGTGTWGLWTHYAEGCTSACGVGVRISNRTCSNKERAEACRGHRYRAKLCNTKACPGDELKTEVELRKDRADYTCNMLKKREGPFSHFIRPYARAFSKKELTAPISVESCLVQCDVNPRSGGLPHLQRSQFGRAVQTDGAACGPVNRYERRVLGITTRCLRGRCVEFGCNGRSMEHRNGKVKDMCGVCGGDNSTCNCGHKTVRLEDAEIGTTETIMELPAGTRDIMFALKSDKHAEELSYKLALMDKDDSEVIVPGGTGRFEITDNEKNPLNFAGTHWTTVDNEVLTADGPIDQPVKIKVKKMKSSSSSTTTSSSTRVETKVTWRYKEAHRVPNPPACLNNGVANFTNGGCMCVQKNTHGKQCEYFCHDLCFNGGRMLKGQQCRCDCRNNPHTTGDRCECKPGFAGPDCSECAIQQCYNGGVLNPNTCRCQCPAGCNGKPDCSDCNYNPLLSNYKGQYGRGSLEEVIKASDDFCGCA